jgi:hypothetical protein
MKERPKRIWIGIVCLIAGAGAAVPAMIAYFDRGAATSQLADLLLAGLLILSVCLIVIGGYQFFLGIFCRGNLNMRVALSLLVVCLFAAIAVWRNWQYRHEEHIDGLGCRLHRAARNGDIEAVGLLLEEGAPVDWHEGWSGTPTDRALMNGHTNVADLLLEHGGTITILVTNAP